MKILIYESDKGMANYTYNFANELVRQGVEVVYMTSEENPYRNLLDKRVKDCCILKQVSGRYKRRTIKWAIDRIYKCLFNILARNRVIHREKPTVVNIHSTIYALDKFLFTRKKNTKYIMTIHNVEGHELTFDEKFKLDFWKKQDGLIVHTPENVEELKTKYKLSENVFLIPHGADISYKKIEKKECREKYGISLDSKVILSFGVVREYKGIDVLIEALTDIEDCTLLLAGKVDSDVKEAYEREMKKNKVRFVWLDGFIDENDIPYIFQCSDIAVLPYKHFNSQSGVLLRIATYNLPVIATDVGDFKRFINTYKMGIICQPNDSESLHSAIIRMVSDNNLEQYAQGARKAAFDNSWEHAAECYLESFKKLTHSNA